MVGASLRRVACTRGACHSAKDASPDLRILVFSEVPEHSGVWGLPVKRAKCAARRDLSLGARP